MIRPSALSFLIHCACCLLYIPSALPCLLRLAKSTVVLCVCVRVWARGRARARARARVCSSVRECSVITLFCVAIKWRISTPFNFDQHWRKWFSALFSSLSLSRPSRCFCLSSCSETCTVSLALRGLMATEKHPQFNCRTQGLEYRFSIAFCTVLLP